MLSAGMCIMWTLTYASNMEDREKAIRDRKEWERRVRRVYPHYIGISVLEKQERGAWHWHIAVKDWFDVRVMRRLWQETIGESARVHVGFRPDGRGNAYTKIATYMSKYMSKDHCEAIAEKNRYHVSGDVGRPARERYSVPLSGRDGLEFEIAVQSASALFGYAFRTWLAPISDKAGFGYAVFERDNHQPKGGEEQCST